MPDANAQLTYSQYLKIQELLALQKPLTEPLEHDETLFIVIHQAYELWFKQILHELEHGDRLLAEGKLAPFVRTLGRIDTILQVLVHQVDILETMTPNDFNRFRDKLNPASGFQSLQFRLFEARMGARNREFLKNFDGASAGRSQLEAAQKRPSIYDRFLALMAQRGLAIPSEILRRPVDSPYVRDDRVVQAFLQIYQVQGDYYDLYVAAEKMIDLDEKVLLWRYRHVAMVERMIGNRRGTGGSSGVKYLTATLAVRFFPEIWEVRNLLGASYGSQ
jgi:tryptophan 2,3-dioxygenase